jgi:signal transduction histidine kinase
MATGRRVGLDETPRNRARGHIQKTEKRASLTHAAVLQERARIARELHDSVSQTLYAIAIDASRARKLLGRNESREAQTIVEDVLRLATSGQSELRALLTDIRSDELTSGGLVAALERLVAEVEGRRTLKIRLKAARKLDVPAPTREALVLIAREALHNVVRHSGARRVDIMLELQRGQLVLLINDDGCGFDPATPRPGHFGLQSICERAAEIGGSLELHSSVGLGTQLRVSVPLRLYDDG